MSAAKFYIIPKWSKWWVEEKGGQQLYTWTLKNGDDEPLLRSGGEFNSVAEARTHISAVKKAVRKFTKVEVEDAE